MAASGSGWRVFQTEHGTWTFSYWPHGDDDRDFPTREAALETLVEMLAKDTQHYLRLLTAGVHDQAERRTQPEQR